MASKLKSNTNPNSDDHDEDGRSTVSTDDLFRIISESESEQQRAQFAAGAALAELREQIRPAAVSPVPPDDNPRQTIKPPSFEQLPGDIALRDFLGLEQKWSYYARLERLNRFPRDEQMAAFRMSLSTHMLHTVDKVLGTLQAAELPQ